MTYLPLPKFKLTEAEITKEIRQYLNMRGVFHWKNWQGPMSGINGIPDIIGCHKGKLIGIEVKRKGGKVSPKQNAFINRINDAGGLAFVAYSVSDVIEKLGIETPINRPAVNRAQRDGA